MNEVIDIEPVRRSVKLKDGVEVIYNYLIVATGANHSYFGRDEWVRFAPGLKTLEDAVEIRRRILTAFESAERDAIEHGSHQQLNFVVVGGGPSGVELAGAISDTARLYMTRDLRHIKPAETRVVILEGSPHVLGSYSDDLQRRAMKQLQALKVDVRAGAKVTDVQPGFVMVGEERIPSACTLWAAGVAASPLGEIIATRTGATLDHKGCVIVARFLNPKDHPEIFLAGDLAHVEEKGNWCREWPSLLCRWERTQQSVYSYSLKHLRLPADRRPFITSIKVIWLLSAGRPPLPGLHGLSRPIGQASWPGSHGSVCMSSS